MHRNCLFIVPIQLLIKMFEYSISSFGKFVKHSFSDENGNAFSVVPEFGASLIELKFKGISVLDSYATPEALIVNKWSKGIFLFPYPNRLRDGKYEHLGEHYQFDINNKATGNSIHGFGKNVPMHVSDTRISNAESPTAFITCSWQHDGSTTAYPFPFRVDISFEMGQKHSENKSALPDNHSSYLTVTMKFKNLANTSVPVGLGWHPYFILTPSVNDTQLQMPHGSQIIDIDKRMLPTGKKETYTTFDTLKLIGETVLDSGFYLKDANNGTQETIIAHDTQNHIRKLSFWQETGPCKFNFLQVFTPPHRKSIAIEPMTCNIDAFNNKDGLVLLSPDAELEGKFGINFELKLG